MNNSWSSRKGRYTKLCDFCWVGRTIRRLTILHRLIELNEIYTMVVVLAHDFNNWMRTSASKFVNFKLVQNCSFLKILVNVELWLAPPATLRCRSGHVGCALNFSSSATVLIHWLPIMCNFDKARARAALPSRPEYCTPSSQSHEWKSGQKFVIVCFTH